MKKNIIIIMLVCFAFASHSQIKLTTDGRIGFGTITPNTSYKFEFVTGNNWGIRIDGRNMMSGGKTIRSIVEASDHYSYEVVRYQGSTPYSKFWVKGDGTVWTSNGYLQTSDESAKENIKTLASPLTKLQRINGVQYSLKNSTDKVLRFGFLAQELKEVFPEMVQQLEDESLAVEYNAMLPVLVEAVKEQQKTIEVLQEEINTLKSNLNLTEINDGQFQNIKLYQNAPNPFNQQTIIKCDLPENYKSAMICVYDMQGLLLKEYKLTQSNKLTIEASQLKPGMYYYSLIVDNKVIDTKKMILSK